MPNRIYDVDIKTANKKKMTKFYTETMGLKLHHTCAQCDVLDLSEKQYLVILADKKFAAVKNPKTLRTTFGFQVEDVDAVWGELKAKKVKFDSKPEDQDWGARVAVGYDPDGNPFTLVQEKPELFDAKKHGAPETEAKEPVTA